MPAVTTANAVPGNDVLAAQYNALRSEMLASRPVGEGRMWFTNSAPEDFLLCQGQEVSRSTYAALFAVIGTTFGAGNGTSTFNLPDFQDRFPMGKSGTKAVGSTGGSATVNLAHTHSGNTGSHTLTIAEIPSHTHDLTGQLFSGNNNPPYGTGYVHGVFGTAGIGLPEGQWGNANTGGGGGHTHPISSDLSSSQSVLNPYLAVNWIIRYQ